MKFFAGSVFWGLIQSPRETFNQFYEKVKIQAVDCNLGAALFRNIRDKLVFGMKDNELRERLLREKALLEKYVVEQIRICELSHIRATAMAGSSGCADVVNRKTFVANGDVSKSVNIDCKNCGSKHTKKNCQAFGKTCHKCGKKNHWQNMCHSGNESYQGRNFNKNKASGSKQLHELQDNVNENFQLGVITVVNASLPSSEVNKIESNNEWIEQLSLNDNIVFSKLDTGAHVNVISECVIQKWSIRPQIHSIPVKIKV